MKEEEEKMRDNIALVAMQCILNRKVKTNFLKRLFVLFDDSHEYSRDPDEVACEAYEYADAMMRERKFVNDNID